MNISFENQVALVTGRRVGARSRTAKRLLNQVRPWCCRTGTRRRAGAPRIWLAGGHKTLAIRCDVSDDAEVERWFAQTVAAFGRSTLLQQWPYSERPRRDGRLTARRLRSRHGDQPAPACGVA